MRVWTCVPIYHQWFSEKQYTRVLLFFCVSNFLWTHLGCLGKRELSGILARKILNIIQIIISDKVFYSMMPEVYHGATKLSMETRCTDKCICLYCGDTLFNTYTTGVLHKRDSQTNGQLLTMWNHPIGYLFEFLISWTSSKLFIKGGKTERMPSLSVTKP